jgi:predicted GIY-YIG superfamily endonuclease
MSFLIYALKCQHGKYYVGKTKKPINVRFREHVSGTGSEWTKLHSPIEILETKPGDKWEEDTMVHRMIEKYGIDNVRGGTYCNIKLTSDQINELNTKIISVNDLCYKCHLPGHFANKCPQERVKNHRNKFTGIIPNKSGIYVLALENNKWSVNYSSNMKKATDDMLDTGTTKWTQTHKPLHVSKIFPGLFMDEVNDITLDLMKQYGWENVRGGSWSMVNMKTAPEELYQ